RAVKVTPLRCMQICGRSRTRRESRPIVEDGIAVQVLTGDDVERRSGVRYNERTHAKAVRKRNASAEEQPVPYIDRPAAVVGADAQQWIRREAAGSGGVALGITQRVVTEQAEPRTHANVEIGDELVLTEDAFGYVFVRGRRVRNQRVR